MNQKTIHTHQRGFVSISTPDGRYRLWIPRPSMAGIMHCNCGFGLQSHRPFVDAIDRLEYVSVEAVEQLDEDFSTLVIQCKTQPYRDVLPRLLEDLPELMEEHL